MAREFRLDILRKIPADGRHRNSPLFVILKAQSALKRSTVGPPWFLVEDSGG